MTNNTVKIGLGFALAWCLIKYIYFLIDPFAEINAMVMINILFLLLSIAIGLYLVKRSATEETNALVDIKNGMRAGVPYALMVSLFIFVYYTKINPEYNEQRISNYRYELKKVLDDPVKFEELRSSNPEIEIKSKEEILENKTKEAEANYSATAITTLSLLGMLLLSTLYSIMVTVVYRRIMFRR